MPGDYAIREGKKYFNFTVKRFCLRVSSDYLIVSEIEQDKELSRTSFADIETVAISVRDDYGPGFGNHVSLTITTSANDDVLVWHADIFRHQETYRELLATPIVDFLEKLGRLNCSGGKMATVTLNTGSKFWSAAVLGSTITIVSTAAFAIYKLVDGGFDGYLLLSIICLIASILLVPMTFSRVSYRTYNFEAVDFESQRGNIMKHLFPWKFGLYKRFGWDQSNKD